MAPISHCHPSICFLALRRIFLFFCLLYPYNPDSIIIFFVPFLFLSFLSFFPHYCCSAFAVLLQHSSGPAKIRFDSLFISTFPRNLPFHLLPFHSNSLFHPLHFIIFESPFSSFSVFPESLLTICLF